MRQRSWRRGALALLLLAGVALEPLPAAASSDGAPMLLGLAVRGDLRIELDDFAAQQGKAPALSQLFFQPKHFVKPEPWAGGLLSDLHARGITAFIEWVSTDIEAMASGGEDAQIRNFYDSIDDFLLGGPSRSVVIAPNPEANLDEHAWCCRPIAYQKAFRRMRVLAREAGLGPAQVRFAFWMNGLNSRGRSYDQFYPGDEHVDVVAFSRINRGSRHASGWQNYDATFGGPLRTIHAQLGTTKPVLVAQTASVTAGGDRAAWLRDMFTGLAAEPDVVGAIYFNTDNGHEFRVHSKSAGIPLDPTFKSGYQKWSPPSEADWLFDGRLDDWVTARGGTPAVWPPRTDDPPPATDIFAADQGVTTRVGGATALGSAIAISKARFTADTARHVVLSRDDRFPDALAGTPLVGDGPLLLTPTAALHSAVRSELDRVLPKGGRVYLLGGPGALAPGISDSLTAAGYDVVRLAGSDRLATSVVIADAVATLYPASAETVLVARGFGTADNPTAAWADSVTGGGFAASRRHPVVLSESHALSSDAANFLRGRREAILLGGPGALSERVRSDSADRVSQVRRVAGTGRDLTAVAIMSQLWQRPPGEFRMIAIDGYSTQGWAFGLPAAGLSADFAAPLLLVEANAVPKATADTVRSCHSKRVATAIVGAPQVISDAVRNAIEALDHSC